MNYTPLYNLLGKRIEKVRYKRIKMGWQGEYGDYTESYPSFEVFTIGGLEFMLDSKITVNIIPDKILRISEQTDLTHLVEGEILEFPNKNEWHAIIGKRLIKVAIWKQHIYRLLWFLPPYSKENICIELEFESSLKLFISTSAGYLTKQFYLPGWDEFCGPGSHYGLYTISICCSREIVEKIKFGTTKVIYKKIIEKRLKNDLQHQA